MGKEPSDLPNRISPNEVLKRLADRLDVSKGRDASTWEKSLQGKNTMNIMKDLFWWFFADKFSPEGADRRVEQQDQLFGRMASNFICLLASVPQQQKDRFFDRYHDILSQAVFAAFRVAFPNSEAKLGSDFRAEIARLFAYWSTGADIGPPEYVLKNGREVKRNMGGAVLEVVGEMQREQSEIEQMTTDNNKKKGRPAAETSGTKSRSEEESMGKGGAAAAGTGSTRPGHRGGGMVSPQRGMASGETTSKGGATGGVSGAGAAASSSSLPPVPPLRLPPKPDTELRTPRAIWTDRTGAGASDASQAAAAARGSKTERAKRPSTMGSTPRSAMFPRPPAMPDTPRSMMTPRTPHGHIKQVKPGPSGREVAPSRQASGRDVALARQASKHQMTGLKSMTGGQTPVGGAVKAGGGRGGRGGGQETPMVQGVLKKAPLLGDDAQKKQLQPGLSRGDSLSTKRVSVIESLSPTEGNDVHAENAGEASAPAKQKGRAYDKSGKRPFDLNSMTPFMAYYMATQVSTVSMARKTYKRIQCDEVVKSWDVPRPPPKQKWGDEEEEEGEETAKYPKTAREVGEAAVKRNARIVREYNKKAAMRSQSIGMTHQQAHKLNIVNRKELQGIMGSQDLSNAFSNMLVSSGGGLTFDAIWKKQGQDITARFGGGS